MENGSMKISIIQLLFRVNTKGLKGRHILQDTVVDGFIRVVYVTVLLGLMKHPTLRMYARWGNTVFILNL